MTGALLETTELSTTQVASNHMDGRLAVNMERVGKSFAGRRVLEQASLRLAAGEFVAVIGASGSGKTTILRMLAGLEEVDVGTVLVPERRAVVFQEPRLIAWKRVIDNVNLGLKRGRMTRDHALAMLEEVGLRDRTGAWPSVLSGGEAQRVALARALVRAPELLLLDEPLAALDALTRLRMQDLIERLWLRHRPAVLLVTHDVEEAVALADRVVLLRQGRIAVERQIELERPRVRQRPEFTESCAALLTDLGVLSG